MNIKKILDIFLLKTVVITLLLIFSQLPFLLNAQTCSCAGAPIFNPLDYSSTQNQHRWHFQLTYKYHSISDLVEGKTKINDDTDRSRTAQSIFFETRLALTSRLSVMALMNFTGHSREVGISDSGADTTSGIGDSMLSVQYSPIVFNDEKGVELAIGGGIKAPTGRDDVTLTGVAAEDMQPGTGSWDTIVWSQGSIRLKFIRGLELFGGASYRINGSNDRDYGFGNELISAVGLKLRTGGILDYSLYTRYRWADSDQRFAGDVPNTGGKWLYLVPAITIKSGKNMGIKTEVEIPVYRNLKGFRQFTSTFLLSLSLYYEI
jgi:hypothetical protein